MMFKKLIFLLLFAIFHFNPTTAVPAGNKNSKKTAINLQDHQKFQSWKERHLKTYKSTADEERAMKNMIKNLREIEAHNALYDAGKVSYSRAIWEYSDLSYDEKQVLLTGNKEITLTNTTAEPKSARMMAGTPTRLKAGPAEVNWVKEGLVHPIRNQGKCGSCWSYTAVAVTEGVLLKNGIKTKVSEQNLVDCSKNGGNSGCNGGYSSAALNYISKSGIVALSDYPYTGRNGKCKASNFEKINFRLGRVKYEKLRGNENRLKDIVANYGPVAIAINAADSFMNYNSGVYDNPKCSKKLDHAMTLVGYGTDSKTRKDFWLIKNSWGTSWGENGYVRMSRNDNNQCGIANEVAYIE